MMMMNMRIAVTYEKDMFVKSTVTSRKTYMMSYLYSPMTIFSIQRHNPHAVVDGKVGGL